MHLIFVSLPYRIAESRLTDGDSGNTDPFLEDLQPNNQLDSSTDVEIAATSTKEHGKI